MPCLAAAAAAAAFQAVARRVAYQTFSHVLELDITFHMNRRTGRLSRILERGEHQQR
jgi:ABC-type transport system involved in Fe-S cluster assembly fused permease/ATPase subunit